MNISAYISLPKANGDGCVIYVFSSSYPSLGLVSFFYFSVFLSFIKLSFCVRIPNWTKMVTSIINCLFYDREEA